MDKKKIFLAVIIFFTLLGIYVYGQIHWPMNGVKNETVYFQISKGESVIKIAKDLADKKLVKSEVVFRLYAKYRHADEKFQAGGYSLAKNLSMKQVIDELLLGANTGNEKSITIIEGWQGVEIGDYLVSMGVTKKTDFIKAIEVSRWRSDYDFLADKRIKTLEGFMFPDTYRIYASSTIEAVVKKMLDNFETKLTSDMISAISKEKKKLYDVMILASIVEKEASSLSLVDKKIVAGIFWNRLSINMPLQSDATVNYITGKSNLRPTYDELGADSLYNTYKYAGLPPTPIANPGLEAIEAAIYSVKTDYLYFLTDKDGRIHYGKTFEDHNKNIRQFLD
ncbi:MAG: endolytic transglycosylase MltG [bacterium]